MMTTRRSKRESACAPALVLLPPSLRPAREPLAGREGGRRRTRAGGREGRLGERRRRRRSRMKRRRKKM
jgi:hypothetical protein